LNLLGVLAVGSALNLQLSTAFAQRTGFTLLTTFTNPTPEVADDFGWCVAAVGTERVLIGAPFDNTGASGAGAAYLFSTNGTLLTTFTNPTPAYHDAFGWSVAAVGTDRVMIGAYRDESGANYGGAAYLFSTDGVLLTTIANSKPTNSQFFGWSIVAMGTDRVLIGALYDNTGADYAGAAYLFSTNGTLLMTFTNPTPAANDFFGESVGAVGSDRVLIGASRDDTGATDAGAAYLFSTNGTLLTMFTNPMPAASDWFGSSVAAVGADRVLIGADGNDTGAHNAGAAYLFSTNGALLTMFTNPTPAADDYFGSSVTAVGTDRVLIGAYLDDTGAVNTGAAYLFSTNGALLATFTNPAPADYDVFGDSVAAMGSDRVLIGAYMGYGGTGAVYLFTLEPFTPRAPSLSISLNPQLSTITLSWPAPSEGWVLECTNALPSTAVASWPQVLPPYQTNGGTVSVAITNNPATGNQFFRLHKP
jgi:hypothetical protein